MAYARVLVEQRRFADADEATRRADGVEPRIARALAHAGQPAGPGPAGRRRGTLRQALHGTGGQPARRGRAQARPDAGLLPDVAGSPNAARISPAPTAGWRGSTTPRTSSPRNRAGPGCWRARAAGAGARTGAQPARTQPPTTGARNSRPKCSCCATRGSSRPPTTCWPPPACRLRRHRPDLRPGDGGGELNRLDEMERLLRRLIELKPENQNAYNALGYSLADRNVRLEEARTLIRKAVATGAGRSLHRRQPGLGRIPVGATPPRRRASSKMPTRSAPTRKSAPTSARCCGPPGQRDRAVAIWKEATLADAENETLQATLKRLRIKL